jgi:hypothetical protein
MRRPRRATKSAQQVLTEARRLLNGQALETYPFERHLPSWAPVNCLAHSDIEQLGHIAADRSHDHPGSWSAILAYLATDLLAAAPSPAELRRVQREALIPLELRIFEGTIPPPKTPGQLAKLVGETLDTHHI